MLLTTTAVFQIVPECASSRSRIGDTITMLCLRARREMKSKDGPRCASSANSHHGAFSRVHMKKGDVQHSCRHSTLTPHAPAASIIFSILSKMAWRCATIGSVVGRTIEFCTTPKRTMRGARVCQAAHGIFHPAMSKSPAAASCVAAAAGAMGSTGAPKSTRLIWRCFSASRPAMSSSTD